VDGEILNAAADGPITFVKRAMIEADVLHGKRPDSS
jgi:hypothetical protein